jgi:hypothetical protein
LCCLARATMDRFRQPSQSLMRMRQVEDRLDEFQFIEDEGVSMVAHEIDTGVEQRAGQATEYLTGKGLFLF